MKLHASLEVISPKTWSSRRDHAYNCGDPQSRSESWFSSKESSTILRLENSTEFTSHKQSCNSMSSDCMTALTYKGERYTYNYIYCESPTIFSQAMSANLGKFESPQGSQILLYVAYCWFLPQRNHVKWTHVHYSEWSENGPSKQRQTAVMRKNIEVSGMNRVGQFDCFTRICDHLIFPWRVENSIHSHLFFFSSLTFFLFSKWI